MLETYSITGCELLLCAYDCSASLGGVEGAFASYDCLSCGATAAGLAADFGDGVPVVHGQECVMCERQRVVSDGRYCLVC